MKNRLNRTIGLMILSALSLSNTFAQTEYLVKVNPATGVYDKIKNLPDANWIYIWPNYTTFDETNHHYIFRGSQDEINWKLFTVDAVTGNIISSPSFPVLSDTLDNVIELQYDNAANILYGLHWDNSDSTEYLVSINPTTGLFTKINKEGLPGVKWIMSGNTTFDDMSHRFVFKGGDNDGNWFLYTVNATTGNIISSPPFPAPSTAASSNSVIGLQYDNSTHKYYGLNQPDYVSGETFLISVDPVTGLFTQIGLVPGLRGITKTTFDEIHHRLICVGPDNGGIWHLYSIDVSTGNVISSPSFPELSSNTDNVIEFQYDNSSSNLYALRWDPNVKPTTGILNNQLNSPSFNLYPNPFSQNSKLLLDKSYKEITIFIYNSIGQVVGEQTAKNSSAMDIQRNNLSSGVYFIAVICDHINVGTKKMIVK